MDRIDSILKEMSAFRVEPDHITYNTIIKGLCHDRRLEQALDMKNKMRSRDDMVADAHTYGSLLDGCSRLGKWQQGVDLLDEMLAEKVTPNNITLTALVRLAGLSRQTWALDRAFQACEEYPRQYGLRLNDHVYKNLCVACVSHGDLERAVGVIAQAALAKQLDVSIYEPVLAAMSAKRKTCGEAVAMLRLAAGLRVSRSEVPASLCDVPATLLRMRMPNARMSNLMEKTLVAIAAFDQCLAVPLARELEQAIGLQLDGRTKLQLAKTPGVM